MKTNHNSFASTKDRGAPSKERRKPLVGRFLSERPFSWRTDGEEMSLVLLFEAHHRAAFRPPFSWHAVSSLPRIIYGVFHSQTRLLTTYFLLGTKWGLSSCRFPQRILIMALNFRASVVVKERGDRQAISKQKIPYRCFQTAPPKPQPSCPQCIISPEKAGLVLWKLRPSLKKKTKKHISTSTELCDLDRTHLTIELSPTGNAYWASNLETF